MSGLLSSIERLFGRAPPDPAIAAAAILASRPTARRVYRSPVVPASPVAMALRAVAAAPPTLPGALASPEEAGLLRGLLAVAPHLTDAARAGWVAAMTGPLGKAAITSARCVAAFLGQCAVESGGFLILEEDLSYSAERLCQVWPNRFSTAAAAAACAFQPEILANQVYADRLGNGSTISGDGWQFRGRGLIQLSGRANYQRFATAMNLDLDAVVQDATSPTGAAESAAWFWQVNGLNELATAWSLDLITRKINGGTTGAARRSQLCEAALRAIGN